MLPGLNISLPSLSLSSLSLDTIRQFKREVARIKIVFPTATCRALLDTDLVDCVESTFDVTMDSLSDDQMMAYVLRLVGPIDYNNWVEALNAVECSAETTHANSRLQNVRDYIARFKKVVALKDALDLIPKSFAQLAQSTDGSVPADDGEELGDPISDEEEDDEEPEDLADSKARKIFKNHIKTAAFQRVLRAQDEIRKPETLADLYSLATDLAKEDDQVRALATRYGYYTAKKAQSSQPSTITDDSNQSNSSNTAGLGRRRGRGRAGKPQPKPEPDPSIQTSNDAEEGAKPRSGTKQSDTSKRKNDVDPEKPPPHRDCSSCGGWHWDNQCPHKRFSRSNGTLRPDPRRREAEGNNADPQEAGQALTTPGSVNGDTYSFIIDTGSGITCMSESVARSCDKTPSLIVSGPTINLRLANGSSVACNRYMNATLKLPELGKFPVITETRVLIIPGEKDKILLGTPILKELGFLTPDSLFIPFNRADESDPNEGDDIASKYIDVNATGAQKTSTDEDPLAKIAYLSDDIAEECRAIVEKFKTLFEVQLPPEGSSLRPMSIPLSDDNKLVQSKPRHLSPADRELVREWAKDLRADGFARDSSGPFSSPLVLVRSGHKSGKTRICVDYTQLNRITVQDKFPLPDLRTFAREATGCKYFAALDCRKGYFQQLVNPADIYKTAIVTPDDYIELKRVGFGLCNAPSGFQRAMQEVLAPVLHKGTWVYIDDIVVMARSKEEFLKLLDETLRLLLKANLRLSAEKCTIGAPEIKIVGFQIDEHGRRVDPERKEAIAALRAPTDVSALRRILGKFNYVSTFIPDAANTLAPLNALLKKDRPFIWSKEHADAFQATKDAIQEGVELVFPDTSLPWELYTDASGHGVGGVLFQRRGDKKEIISFFAKTLDATQRRWTTYERELYGILFCLTRPEFEPLFRLKTDLTVFTDHKNLLYLYKSSLTNQKIARWKLILADFHPTIHHVEGEANIIADVLSRDCNAVEVPSTEEGGDEAHRAVISTHHDGPAGHPGARETITRLRDAGITWRGMSRDVKGYIHQCVTCQKLRKAPLQPTVAHSTQRYQPFQVVQIDTVGPLPKSGSNRYIIVFIDVFSKYLMLVPVPTLEAKYAGRAMIQLWSIFGKPAAIQTDNGSQFKNRLIDGVNDAISLSHRFSTSYHPASNGVVERHNGSIANVLRAMLMDGDMPQDQWSTLVPLAQYVLNSRTPRATGISPLTLITGRTDAQAIDPEQLAAAMALLDEDVAEKHWLFLARTRNAAAEALHRYDTRSDGDRPQPWSNGDYCLLRYPSRAPHKLAPCLRGPLLVVRAGASPNAWVLEDLLTGTHLTVHAERMIPVDTGGRSRDELVAMAAKDVADYVVESVVSHRIKKGPHGRRIAELKVRWQGYEPAEDSFIPFNSDNDRLEALDAYFAAHPEAEVELGRFRKWRTHESRARDK